MQPGVKTMHVTKRFGLLTAAAVLLLAEPGPANDPPKGSGTAPKESIPAPRVPGALDPNLWPSGLTGGEPFELLIRGERSRFGRFDADGNFLPEPFHESFPAGGPLGGPISFRFTNHVKGPCAMGEHRSGRLILGTMVKGVFVPEIGSKVLDIKKDFDLKKPERIVYNLAETVAAFWTEERKKQFPKGLPNDPEPPLAGVPAGWKVVPFWKLVSGRPDWRDVRVIGGIAEFGQLDERGEFIPDYGLPIVSRDGIKGLMRNDPWSGPRFYTLPQPPYLRWPSRKGETQDDPEDVYDYRFGRLIKGMLHKTGNFVPELGSMVIDFKDHDPLRDRRRIYNLPGVLRRVE
jgi:hypothetical protein